VGDRETEGEVPSLTAGGEIGRWCSIRKGKSHHSREGEEKLIIKCPRGQRTTVRPWWTVEGGGGGGLLRDVGTQAFRGERKKRRGWGHLIEQGGKVFPGKVERKEGLLMEEESGGVTNDGPTKKTSWCMGRRVGGGGGGVHARGM